MPTRPTPPFAERIDKLTRSIENVVTGESFPTDVVLLSATDLRLFRPADWAFNWKKEARQAGRQLFKLTTQANPTIIHGLISVEDLGDLVFMHLIESASFNRGQQKQYAGVLGNLVAFACKQSFEANYGGFVVFESKTALIPHYEQQLGATHFRGLRMFIETPAARKLVAQYFPFFFRKLPS